MGGRLSRNKGKRGEREVVNLLKSWGYKGIKREWSIQSEVSSGVDVTVKDPALAIQVKFGKSPPIGPGYLEAKKDAPSSSLAVCFSRKAGREESGEWLVTISAEDFRKLLDKDKETEGAWEAYRDEKYRRLREEIRNEPE